MPLQNCWAGNEKFILNRNLAPNLIALVLVLLQFQVARAQLCEPTWSEGFDQATGVSGTPANNPVRALEVFDDGSGIAMYVGGSFTQIGGVSAKRIARFDGSNWSEVGGGLSGTVTALHVHDDGTGPALYVAGEFNAAGGVPSANGIARWNGLIWEALESGTSADIFCMETFDAGSGPELFVGTEGAGDNSNPFFTGVAKWDGQEWSSIGANIFGSVLTLESFDDGQGNKLFAGGIFDFIGGVGGDGIAAWDGENWISLPEANSPSIPVLSTRSGTVNGFSALFVGSASGLRSWDGTSWDLVGPIDGSVTSLEIADLGDGPRLFVAGSFLFAGNVEVQNIASWDGTSWFELGAGLNNSTLAMHTFSDGNGDSVYVGGRFSDGGGVTVADGIARWNGSFWSLPSGDGVNGIIDEFFLLNDGTEQRFYAVGEFTSTGGVSSRAIAEWTGTQWLPLSNGLASVEIRDAKFFDDGTGPMLHVAGSFSSIGGVAASNIARWTGTNWEPLGAGTNVAVNAIEVFDDGSGSALYAACDFFIAGGVPVNRIARWDGTTWNALGELGGGVGGAVVNDLEAFDLGDGPRLFVGGNFTSAGGNPDIAYLAQWDGTHWAPAMSGISQFPPIDGPVTEIDGLVDAFGAGLWVRGTFTRVLVGSPFAEQVFSSRIALLRQSGFVDIGGGANSTVRVVCAFDDGTGPIIFAGGDFTNLSGAFNRIARWNGTAWATASPVGATNSVRSMAVLDDGSGDALYVGGRFTEFDGLAARHIAKWDGIDWSVLDVGVDEGSPFGTSVNALAPFAGPNGPSLYVGGDFSIAGGMQSKNFARWNGCGDSRNGNGADLNGDGLVNGADLATLLSHWGTDGLPSSADLNSDGIVNGADLATLLGLWSK